MTNYPLIMRAVSEAVWAILPAKLEEIKAFLALKAAGVEVPPMEAAARPRQRNAGAIAVIPVFGTITQRANIMTDMSGGTSTEMVGNQISAALGDPNIAGIVLDVDSPGGTPTGATELASLIRDGRNRKPIVASANSLMASAAYWIGSSASEVVATPSADVGSIGVFTVHQDVSGKMANDGINPTIISAGKHKVEGNPFGPLDDEARAAIQARVDEAFNDFVGDVAKGRGVSATRVRNGFGEGRVLSAKAALAEGMIDRIETLDQTLRRIAANPDNIGRTRADAEGMTLTAQSGTGNVEFVFGADTSEVEADAPASKLLQRRRQMLDS